MTQYPAKATAQGCVLVVDDDDATREVVGASLESAGFETLLAGDGARALELFATHHVDVVVTDVTMPGINGYDLCAMLRVMPGGNRVQILFMTGLDDVEAVQRAYEVGASDFIVKTRFNAMLVVERVRFQLRAQHLQDELRLSEQRLAYAQRLAQLGHWERTLEGQTLAVSPVVIHMLGLDQPTQLSWQHLCKATHADDLPLIEYSMKRAISERGVFRLEHRLTNARGKLLVLRHHGEVVMASDGRWTVRSTVQDVTETRAQEERIRFLAFHDPLTALPNRESLLRSLTQTIKDAAVAPHTNSTHVAVFAIAIDDFTRIAATKGKYSGDVVIKTISDRLRGQIRDSDHLAQDLGRPEESSFIIARGEGDRFLCVVTNLSMSEAAISIAKRLQRAIALPMPLEDTELRLTASIGISLYPDDSTNAETLIDNANAALMHVRGQKGMCQLFASEINQQARDRLTMEGELRRALIEKQFVMHYQPRLSLTENDVHGAEALVRWQHPTRGLVMPGEFIPLLEEMDLISDLGDLVIDMVVKQSVLWRKRFDQYFCISFNISPLQFARLDLVEYIENAMRTMGGHPENLEAEITESALLAQPDAVIKALEHLRARGMRIALDDFGTGFSSLSYLRKLPLDILKIDRSFISDIGTTHGGSSLVNAILFMANALDLLCVAEGVENQTQLNFLSMNHCHEVQGWLLSTALPPEDFERWLDNWRSANQHHRIA